MNSIEELKEFREELAERLLEKVFGLTAYEDEKLAVVANIQTALAAIDAVIAKGDLPDNDNLTSFFVS